MLNKLQETVKSAPLGQKSPYPKHYEPGLLHPILRNAQREAMGLNDKFLGFDIWNAYELFWQDLKGKPVRAYATFIIPAQSAYLCESKSVKLYLNSLNHEKFSSPEQVADLIAKDLSGICQSVVKVLINSKDLAFEESDDLGFRTLDKLDISIDTYVRAPELLKTTACKVHEKVVTHLFKSHCLCTGQPDMGSIFIEYSGPKIDDESLLAYLISYRDHAGFSENCIEQIWADLKNLGLDELTIFGRFTRRGGIDINPYRSDQEIVFSNQRLIYQ